MMHPDVHYTCSIRGCADTATDLYSFEFGGRTVHRPKCRHHYDIALHNDWALEHYDPAGHYD
ncbi:hypothetical protein [Nocardia cyriacigeorgica]|uniref:hypothetical protein n=1 Tax=Nocardia cyriacigeorgica TaxID=135487 RepID=UPI002455C049|nr:hypothetical protein [Nocardia cyriacigeorgica]